ncbi:RHS repeat protein [Massilia sp. H6]|nr:RHS repeat domain-containing protein [Massilia sp. H6]UVW28432.1 RHS repeat protein [Massilia sp. H6]
MVAIVSGNGNGVSTSSASVLGQRGVFSDAKTGNSNEHAYVNIATGNLSLSNRDDFLASRGIDVALTRTYNSRGTLNDGNGLNWKMGMRRQVSNLTGSLNYAGSTVTRIDADGAAVVYTYDSTRAAYLATDGGGAYQSMTYNAATQEWVWRSDRHDLKGVHEVYDHASGGRLKSVRDEMGVSLTYGYNASGQLSQVTDATGDTTYFDYAGANLSQIRTVHSGTTSSFVRVRYEYDAQNRLSKVTTDLTPEDGSIADGKVYATTYVYVGTSSRIESVTQSDGSKLSLEYIQTGSTSRFRPPPTPLAAGRPTTTLWPARPPSPPRTAPRPSTATTRWVSWSMCWRPRSAEFRNALSTLTTPRAT